MAVVTSRTSPPAELVPPGAVDHSPPHPRSPTFTAPPPRRPAAQVIVRNRMKNPNGEQHQQAERDSTNCMNSANGFERRDDVKGVTT
ncbi:hypothetical protein ABT273_30515 [Streptomyces humidus]|uniref:hypothetical protein n=1 Tax=Streptomyces humidus TaxID=52259 RepID=UPI0033323AD9